MKKYIRTIIASIVFLAFVIATILTYTSEDYVRARDRLEYLHSDAGRLSVTIEDSMNQLNNRNDSTAYREWKQSVERTEETIQNKQIICLILVGCSLLSLGGVVVLFVQDKKTKKSTC